MAAVVGGLTLVLAGLMLVLVPVGTGVLFAACVVGRRAVKVAAVFTTVALVLVWTTVWAVG